MLDRSQPTMDGIAGASEAFTVDPVPDGWPIMAGPAFSGITGDIARLATANSEADPIAVATTHLIWAGAMFGRTKFQWIGDNSHHGRIFGALVGSSSVARKGTSLQPVKRFWTRAEIFLKLLSTKPFPLAFKLKVVNGLSTGEGLVYAIRDPRRSRTVTTRSFSIQASQISACSLSKLNSRVSSIILNGKETTFRPCSAKCGMAKLFRR
jgi:hypothetical protein